MNRCKCRTCEFWEKYGDKTGRCLNERNSIIVFEGGEVSVPIDGVGFFAGEHVVTGQYYGCVNWRRKEC